MPTGEGRRAVPLVPAAAGPALPPYPDAPWRTPSSQVPPPPPTVRGHTDSSTALLLDAQIPDVLRAKIMAGDYIDLAFLLKPSHIQPHHLPALHHQRRH